jgi:hypothetical protein
MGLDTEPLTRPLLDVTPASVAFLALKHMGEKAEKILKGRYRCVQYGPPPHRMALDWHGLIAKLSDPTSVWKPLNGPIRDWPLAVCDATTVNWKADLEPTDIVSPQTQEENYQVYHRPQHRWFYLSDQTNSELLLFNQFDSQTGPGAFHQALQTSSNRILSDI